MVVYDTTTGKVIEKRTAQGYQAESTWLRGQAWGVYGFTMCFRETKDTTYLNTAVKMADYIAYWGLNLPEDHPKKFRDASAAAIFLSGALELRNYVKNPEKYDRVINKIMDTIIMNYLSEGIHSSGILTHCAYNVNSANPDDWDASTIWGDYYFLEAIKRYKNVKQK